MPLTEWNEPTRDILCRMLQVVQQLILQKLPEIMTSNFINKLIVPSEIANSKHFTIIYIDSIHI